MPQVLNLQFYLHNRKYFVRNICLLSIYGNFKSRLVDLIFKMYIHAIFVYYKIKRIMEKYFSNTII